MHDDEKAREGRARQAAEQRHLWLRRTQVGRDARWYVLVDMASSQVVEGPYTGLEQVEEDWLLHDEDACA